MSVWSSWLNMYHQIRWRTGSSTLKFWQNYKRIYVERTEFVELLAFAWRPYTIAQSNFGLSLFRWKRITKSQTCSLVTRFCGIHHFSSQIRKGLSKEPISILLNTSFRNCQSDFKHSHKMISGAALKPGRLKWSSV